MREQPKFFTYRVIEIIDWYDNLVQGIVECPETGVSYLGLLAWDMKRTIRVSVVLPLNDGEIEALLACFQTPTTASTKGEQGDLACFEQELSRIKRARPVDDPVLIITMTDDSHEVIDRKQAKLLEVSDSIPVQGIEDVMGEEAIKRWLSNNSNCDSR